MSEHVQPSEEISVSNNSDPSSESDSMDYPGSDVDSNGLSITADELTTERVVPPENGASAAISELSGERRIEEITFSAQVSYSIATGRMSSITDESILTDEFSPAFSWVQSDESHESDVIVVSSEAESTVLQPGEVSLETVPAEVEQSGVSSEAESAVVQPREVSSEAASAVVQPRELSSEAASAVVQPREVSSEAASAVVQPREVSSEAASAVDQPREVSSEAVSAVVQPRVVSSETEPPVQQAVSLSGEIAADVIPSPKRRRVFSPKGAKTLDDDDNCSICFESWTTSGNHRPASLKCGHLFGSMCIEKWLKGRGEKCPQCNAKAKRADIRIIFTRNIKAVDTTERDRALEQLAQVQKRNTELMMETAHLGLKYQVVMSECNRLQTELSRAKEEILLLKCKFNGTNTTASSSRFPCTQDIESIMENGMMNNNSQQAEQGRFVWEKTITISDGGNCRVMTHSLFLGTIVVSQPSSVALFPGFGIKKISSLDFKTTEYMTLHSKPIRNLCFHPTYNDGVLLSCSLDKTVKLTSMISNTIVQIYHLPVGAWSCIWNTDDHNYFYVGLQNGLVQEYDVRNTESCVRELNSEGVRSPVASLQYVPACPNAHFRPGGLLAGQLNQVSFHERIPGSDYKTHLLHLDGNTSSLCFDPHTRQMLASFRSSTNYPKVRHKICELSVIDERSSVCSCNTIQTFYGGSTQTLLSRSLLVPHPQNRDHLLVCAGDEASRGVKIWNSKSFQFAQDVPCDGAVVDLCYINMNQHHYLLALTDKQLKCHKWKE